MFSNHKNYNFKVISSSLVTAMLLICSTMAMHNGDDKKENRKPNENRSSLNPGGLFNLLPDEINAHIVGFVSTQGFVSGKSQLQNLSYASKGMRALVLDGRDKVVSSKAEKVRTLTEQLKQAQGNYRLILQLHDQMLEVFGVRIMQNFMPGSHRCAYSFSRPLARPTQRTSRTYWPIL